MNNYSRIAVIGGTGKAGKFLVKELLKRSFSLKILVRHAGDLPNRASSVEVVEGDARNADAIRRLLRDCTAVISTLGQPRGQKPIFSDATTNVIRAMHEWKINRYIVITGLNVDTPSDRKGPRTRNATQWMYTHYPNTTLDKQKEYEILRGSDVDWTLVRLPMIELTETRGEVMVSLEDCPGDRIGAADLAEFLVRELTQNRYVRQSPFFATVLQSQ